jgi:hypothetical protein
MEGKSFLRIAIITICLGVTALGYRNSSGDNTEAIALATKAACTGQGDGCGASLGQQARSSFGHEYSFSVTSSGTRSPPSATKNVVVECKRELVFLGDWACKPKGVGP